MWFQFTGPTPHGFTWGLVLLKDLPKTANTVRYFHAQIKIMTDKSYLQRGKMAINLEHNGKQ